MILPYISVLKWFMNKLLSKYVCVWQDLWPWSSPRSLWPNFTVQWFCLISWHSISIFSYFFQIMIEWVWPDLWPQYTYRSLWPNFMVQWLCLISRHSSSLWTNFFHTMFAYNKAFDPKVVLGQYDLISRFSDFPLYLGTQLVYEHTSFTICMRPLTVKYSWVTVT